MDKLGAELPRWIALLGRPVVCDSISAFLRAACALEPGQLEGSYPGGSRAQEVCGSVGGKSTSVLYLRR